MTTIVDDDGIVVGEAELTSDAEQRAEAIRELMRRQWKGSEALNFVTVYFIARVGSEAQLFAFTMKRGEHRCQAYDAPAVVCNVLGLPPFEWIAGEDWHQLPDGARCVLMREGARARALADVGAGELTVIPAHAELRAEPSEEGIRIRITVLLPIYVRDSRKFGGLEWSGEYVERESLHVTAPLEGIEEKLRADGWQPAVGRDYQWTRSALIRSLKELVS